MLPSKLSFRGVPIYIIFPSKDKFKRVKVPDTQFVQDSEIWAEGFEAIMLNIQSGCRYKKKKCSYVSFYDEKQGIPFVLLVQGRAMEILDNNYEQIVNNKLSLSLVKGKEGFVSAIKIGKFLTHEEQVLRFFHHQQIAKQFRLPVNEVFKPHVIGEAA